MSGNLLLGLGVSWRGLNSLRFAPRHPFVALSPCARVCDVNIIHIYTYTCNTYLTVFEISHSSHEQHPPTMIPGDARHRRRRETRVMAYLGTDPITKEGKKNSIALVYDTDSRRVSDRRTSPRDGPAMTKNDDRTNDSVRQPTDCLETDGTLRVKSFHNEGRSATDLKCAAVARGNGSS